MRRRADRPAKAPVRGAGGDPGGGGVGLRPARTELVLGSNAVVSRFASITDYSRLKEQTLADRYYENDIALQRIRDHPVGGLGWGPDYGAVLLSSDHGFRSHQASLVHAQQYLWIWMRAGIIGLAFSDRGVGLRHLERRALVSSEAWSGRRLARSRHRGVAGRRWRRARTSRSTSRHPTRPCPSSACSRWRRCCGATSHGHDRPRFTARRHRRQLPQCALIGMTIAIVRDFAGAGTRLIMVDNSPGDGAADIVRSADPDATVIDESGQSRLCRGHQPGGRGRRGRLRAPDQPRRRTHLRKLRGRAGGVPPTRAWARWSHDS